MSETEENVIYGYKNEAGVVMYTPNLEFAKVMANKYETFNVYVEKY